MTEPSHATRTFRLVYRSRNLVGATAGARDLGAIFLSARGNNRELDVTGALLVTEDRFVQALEGDEATVRALFDRIEKDSRHDEVTLLDAETVSERVFSRWAMAKVAGSEDSDIPLLADHRRGVVPAAGHPMTPDQEALLDRMRGVART